MKIRSIAAAFGVAIASAGFVMSPAGAAAPVDVVIHVVPNTIPPGPPGFGPCPPFTCGAWDLTSDSFSDSGVYIPLDGDVAPPDRNPFTPGPLFEAFSLSSSAGRGTFTIHAEERLTGTPPNLNQTGVWQIASGTGAYDAVSGHGDVSRTISFVPGFTITLILTGVIDKVGIN